MAEFNVKTVSGSVSPTHHSIDLDTPSKNKTVANWDQSSIQSIGTDNSSNQETSVLDSISNAISSFFSAIGGWFWGSNNATALPGDLKQENPSLESPSLTGRPKLSRPDVDSMNKYADLANKTNGRVKKISDENTDEISAELFGDKFNDTVLLAIFILLLKAQEKNRNEEILIIQDRMKGIQSNLEIVRKDKLLLDQSIDTYETVSKISSAIGVVTIGLTVGGLAVTAGFIFTGGLAAVPIAVVVANALTGLASAFNGLAGAIIKDKIAEKNGLSAQKNFQQGEMTILKRRLTTKDLNQAYKAVLDAQKMMASEARKAYDAQQSLK